MLTKKIKITSSLDWSMRYALLEFIKHTNPEMQYHGQSYHIELEKMIADPIVCGQNLDVDTVLLRQDVRNDYAASWAMQAFNAGVELTQLPHTMLRQDRHAALDVLARGLHPQDYLPKTVLLPEFYPYTDEQQKQAQWEYELHLQAQYTKLGFDSFRRRVNTDEINRQMQQYEIIYNQGRTLRDVFYSNDPQYLKSVVVDIFHNRFPLYLKRAIGHGEVACVYSLEELYQHFDYSRGQLLDLQEGIENITDSVICLSIGPQILTIIYNKDRPLIERYRPEKISLPGHLQQRLWHYAMLLSAYYGWGENSMEFFIKNDQLIPIDVVNVPPETHLTLLHTHFPWLICAQWLWISYCALSGVTSKFQQQAREFVAILNDKQRTGIEKYQDHADLSCDCFMIDDFQVYYDENFSPILDKMVSFYNQRIEHVIRYALYYSGLSSPQQEKLYPEYRGLMDHHFLRQAREYLHSTF